MKYALTKEHLAMVGRKVGCEFYYHDGVRCENGLICQFGRRIIDDLFCDDDGNCHACHGLGHTWEINWEPLVHVILGKPFVYSLNTKEMSVKLWGDEPAHPAWPAWERLEDKRDGIYVYMPKRECPQCHGKREKPIPSVDAGTSLEIIGPSKMWPCTFCNTHGEVPSYLDRLPEIISKSMGKRLEKQAAAILDLDKKTLEV